jgi:hypothetical protein
MNKLNVFLLVILSLIAIGVDCYTGYLLFLMLAMPIGHYLSPILLLLLVISMPTLYLFTIVNLFKLKRWAYWVFYIFTGLLASFLIYIYICIGGSSKKNFTLHFHQVGLIMFFLVFMAYFLLPSTRKMFNK